jgi:hypothetical protein
MTGTPFLDSRADPDGQARLAAETPLLLHSLREFGWLFRDLLAAVEPERVVEVGGEAGESAVAYLEAGAREVVCVDPRPAAELEARVRSEERLRLVVDRSPDCIPRLPPATFWVIDGDHNYVTVRAELEAILTREALGTSSLILLHDVLWPWARRDLYYDPAALDQAGVHPHRWDAGPAIGSAELQPSGFVGRGRFASASDAGGEGNGVRTALEDVLASRPGLECAIVPIVFGLAAVYDRGAPWAPEVAALLRPWDRSPFLTRLELNRLALYSRVLELQHRLESHTATGAPTG